MNETWKINWKTIIAIINRRKKNQVDLSFSDLNNYHQNINLTLELNRKRFLHANLEFQNGILIASVHRKETKLPTPWNSKIPKKYKRNVIIGDLHRSKQVSTDSKEKNIKNKFKKTDFPTKFIDCVIKGFEYYERNKDQQDDFIIPPNLFEEPKPRIVGEIQFCELNEKRLSIFRKKFNYFTNKKIRKIRTCIHYAKFTMVYVLVEKITLERPEETFLYVMTNIISPLISQNQLHTLNRTMTIISLGRFCAIHHQIPEHVRISSPFYSDHET